jgi:hypothetical protein
MELDYALIADEASVYAGRLFIHAGGRVLVSVPQLPWVSYFSLAGRFLAGLHEIGTHRVLGVKLRQPSGETIFPVQPIPFDWTAEHRLADLESLELLFAIKVGLVAFKETGWHLLDVIIDDDVMATLPLRVAIL